MTREPIFVGDATIIFFDEKVNAMPWMGWRGGWRSATKVLPFMQFFPADRRDAAQVKALVKEPQRLALRALVVFFLPHQDLQLLRQQSVTYAEITDTITLFRQGPPIGRLALLGGRRDFSLIGGPCLGISRRGDGASSPWAGRRRARTWDWAG
jgi:hypothetical protein